MICVEGEVSNFTAHTSGHLYFTLKDNESTIKVVMFRGYRVSLKFLPANGSKVIVVGDVSLYDKTGTMQIYAQNLYQSGLGEIYYQFEQLKTKLAQEGLFDASHKKSIPKYPRKIGVITSPTGAAVRDILNILSRRYPVAEVVLQPVNVQGEGAAADIVMAIKTLDATGGCDTLLLARGGGSLEDLYVFNDERIARAIYAAKTPIITGIGHETDYTIVDFVADLRAPTPSAAAELAVPNQNEVMLALINANERLYDFLTERISRNKKEIISCRNVLARGAELLLTKAEGRLRLLRSQIDASMGTVLNNVKSAITAKAAILQSQNPLIAYTRGYAKVMTAGKPIIAMKQLSIGQNLDVFFVDGQVKATIIEKKEADHAF